MSNRLTRVDLLLLMMITFWGANITIIKVALRVINPMAFNCLRFILASIAFSILYRKVFRDKVTGGELIRLALLGVLGNTCYQLLFIHGIEFSHVSHTSILLGTTPVFTAFLSSVLGHETVGRRLWFGVFLSFCGVTLIVFGKNGLEMGDSRMLLGDFFVVLASLIWSVYTTFSKDLLTRYSSRHYVLYTVLFGTLALIPFSVPGLLRQDWSQVGWFEGGALVYSSLMALVFGYSAWYYGVQRLGSTRTSAYGNLTPVAGLAIGMIFLDERLSPLQWLGSVVIFAGIALNRFTQAKKTASICPPGLPSADTATASKNS